MNKKEMLAIRTILENIVNRNTKIDECIAVIDRDIARRMQQSKSQKEAIRDGRYIVKF